MVRKILETTALLMALLFAGHVGHAFAQACVGVPAPQGSVAISGDFGVTDGAKGYGAGVTANLHGPVSLQAGYMLTSFDNVSDNMNTFGVGVGAELPNLAFSACPWAGVEYGMWSSHFSGVDIDVTRTIVPIGFGVATTLEIAPDAGLSLYAVPQFLYFHTRISASDGFENLSEADSTTEFGTRLGFVLGTGAVYGGASVAFITIDDSDPIFGISLGVILGW